MNDLEKIMICSLLCAFIAVALGVGLGLLIKTL